MTMWQDYTERTVEVPGGEVAVLHWAPRSEAAAAHGRAAEPVFLVHGITLFKWMRQADAVFAVAERSDSLAEWARQALA